MKKFLVLYNMPQSGFEKYKNASEEDQQKEMSEWVQWMEQHKDSLADAGNPVGANKRVTNQGVSDAPNEVGGYSIVMAENYEDACALLTHSPHLGASGAYVEVMEIIEMG